MKMLDKLQAVEDRYLDLEAKISDPEVIANQPEWQKATRAHAKLSEVVGVFREYKKLRQDMSDAEEMSKDIEDAELAAMAQAEIKAGFTSSSVNELLNTISEYLNELQHSA